MELEAVKPRRRWSLPRSLRKLFRLAHSAYIGDAIADMMDGNVDPNTPGVYHDHLRTALAHLKEAALINRDRAKARN